MSWLPPSKKVFIDEYVGLSTRLETLPLAFLISGQFGHEVCLDWSELDAIQVLGTRRRSRGLLGRVDAVKLRGERPDEWRAAAHHRNVTLRTHAGPSELLEPLYLPTAGRVRLRPALLDSVVSAFEPHAGRPVIGVHVRRGDFLVADPDSFDVNAREWPAVPDWWYEHAMRRLHARHPDAVFYVAGTGRLEDHAWLRDFEVFEVPTVCDYDYKGWGHGSQRHPAADLFALACCSVLIGTPCSTFTHYAANMLGHATTVLLPPATPISRDRPALARTALHGRGAHDWYATCRTGVGLTRIDNDEALPAPNVPDLAWLARHRGTD